MDAKSNPESLKAKDPIVLDAEGKVLHRPADATADAQGAAGPGGFKIAWGSARGLGLFPKLAIGGLFALMLVLGLTVAGIALGVLFVGFLARTIFRPRH